MKKFFPLLLTFALLLTACQGGPDSGPSSEEAPTFSEASSLPAVSSESEEEPSASEEETLSYDDYFTLYRPFHGEVTAFDPANGDICWSNGTVRFFLDGDMVRREYIPDGTMDDIFKVKNGYNQTGWFEIISVHEICWFEFPPEMEQPPVDAQWESVDEFENSIYMDPDYLLGAVYCTYDVWSGEYKAYGDPYFIERYYSTEAEYPPAYETPASAVSGEPMTYEEYFSLERSVQGNYTTWESGRYDWTDGTVRFFLEDGMVRREYLPDGTIDDICAVQSELNPEGFFYVYSNCRIDWSEYAPEYTQTAVNAYGMTLEEWNIYENGYRPTSVRRIYNAKTDYSMVCGEESILEKYYPDEKPVKTVTRIYGPDGKIKKP